MHIILIYKFKFIKKYYYFKSNKRKSILDVIKLFIQRGMVILKNNLLLLLIIFYIIECLAYDDKYLCTKETENISFTSTTSYDIITDYFIEYCLFIINII